MGKHKTAMALLHSAIVVARRQERELGKAACSTEEERADNKRRAVRAGRDAAALQNSLGVLRKDDGCDADG